MVHFISDMFLLEKDSWKIKKTGKKGWGVFAKRKIKSGVVISDYLGTIIRNADYDLDQDKKGLYLMYFDDQKSIYPDLSKPGPHLINHSCSPNCWIYVYYGHTLFFTLRNIEPNEELTISYLLYPNDGTCKPCTHICKCGSEFCTKTMHLSKYRYDIWHKHQLIENKKTRRKSVSIGQVLPMLSSYPKSIAISPVYRKIYESQ